MSLSLLCYVIWERSWDVTPVIALHYLRLHLANKIALKVSFAILLLKKQVAMDLNAARK